MVGNSVRHEGNAFSRTRGRVQPVVGAVVVVIIVLVFSCRCYFCAFRRLRKVLTSENCFHTPRLSDNSSFSLKKKKGIKYLGFPS